MGGLTLAFDDVSAAGNLTMERFDNSNDPSDEDFQSQLGFSPSGLGPFQTHVFYDINTDATFSGNVQIVLGYDATGLTPAQEQDIRLLHFDATLGSWQDITTDLDTTGNLLSGVTGSFSPLAVAFAVPEPSSAVLAVLGLVCLLGFGYTRKRDRG